MSPGHDIAREIALALRTTGPMATRKRRTTLGDLAHPCERRLAYKTHPDMPLMRHPDPLPGLRRTGTLDRILSALQRWEGQDSTDPNAIRPYADNPRYLVDQRLTLPGVTELRGHAYDTYEHTAIVFVDAHPRTYARRRKRGPSTGDRTRAHLTAHAWTNAGHTIEHVCIVYIPAATSAEHFVDITTDHLIGYRETYDPHIPNTAITRYNNVRERLTELPVNDLPELWAVFTTTPARCETCPFYNVRATDPGQGCIGPLAGIQEAPTPPGAP